MKRIQILIILCCTGLVILSLYHSSLFSSKSQQPTLRIDGHTFTLLIADTEILREKGLSQRSSLPQNTGMLFLFPHPEIVAFWMKGMQFPLDFIFFRNNQVVTIYQNVQTPNKQSTSLDLYRPTSPADSVLEINAGIIKSDTIKIGDKAHVTL